MKRLINLFLVLIMVINLALVGCGKKEPNEDVGGDDSVVETEAGEESEGVTVDKNLLTVDVTLPSEIVGDLDDFNEEEYLAENEGIKTAEVQEDGSLKLTMTKKKHKELVNELEEETESSIKDLIESEETPYIKNVKYNKDFREVNIIVDREAYEEAFDITPLGVGLMAGMYQIYSGKEYETTITIEDADTGDVINSITYPDDLED